MLPSLILSWMIDKTTEWLVVLSTNDLPSVWMGRYLIGWLLGLLTEGLDWLTGWHSERLKGQLIFVPSNWWRIPWMVGWISESLADRLTGSLTNCGHICRVSCSSALLYICTVCFSLLSIVLSHSVERFMAWSLRELSYSCLPCCCTLLKTRRTERMATTYPHFNLNQNITSL